MKTSKDYLNVCLKYFHLKGNITDEDFENFMINYEMFEPKIKKAKTKLIDKKAFNFYLKTIK